MGMYANVNGAEIKMVGLLASVVINDASNFPQDYPGVELKDGLLAGGTCYLTYKNVGDVLMLMRRAFLNGQPGKYNEWAKSISSNRDARSLTYLQDILRFQADVEVYTILAHWYANQNNEGQTIHFG
jgi:hypothetical protein